MSRVGKLPIEIPSNIRVSIEGSQVIVKNDSFVRCYDVPEYIRVSMEGDLIFVSPLSNGRQARSMWGTVRSNLNNIVTGVSKGFSKTLEIRGVGYRASILDGSLNIALGFSHDVRFIIPANIKISVDKQTKIHISGPDVQKVGSVAAEIRAIRKPEPYKGKGVRYFDEQVRIKEGKKK